jgi:putative NADH-flavin reductase
MHILLLGATGNLGLRLIPALLSHSHTITAYVRSPSKLQSLLPPALQSRITVVQGDATDSQAIKNAIIDNKCEGVVSSAGVAALAPWGSSDLPEIFKAVVEAVSLAGVQRGRGPLRVWMMGGQGVLEYPGGAGEMLCKQ